MRLNNLTSRLKISLLLLTLLCTFAAGETIYVDDDSPSDFSTIQAAIDDANEGDIVLVAPGIYTGDGNRDINFKGKAINVRSTDPNDPAIIASTIIDCEGQGRGFTFESGEEADSRLDGVTITNGYAADSGGGIFVRDSSPTITKSTIFRNSTNSRGDGGGIYIFGGRPTVDYCSIIENNAGSGGGLYIHESSPLISKCIISDNYAIGGGGLHIGGMGRPEEYTICMEHCRITSNSANSQAGGLYAILCTLQMSNCIISGNRLLYGGAGGGVSITGLTIAEIDQCTIIGNKVIQDPPGVNCVGGGLFLEMCDVKIANSIIRQNGAIKGTQLAINAWDGQQSPDEPPINDPTLVTLHHNDFNSEQDQEVYIYGEPNLLTLDMYDNLDVDPCFAETGWWDPNGTPDDPNDDLWIDGDYHLMSQTGRWDPNSQSWVKDDVTSPCIDAGDPNSDYTGETWPHGGQINMGAYGGTQEASMSLETEGLFLPRVAYIFSHRIEPAESFDSLLKTYGCSTTLLRLDDVPETSLDSYDLIIVADDTQSASAWNDPNTIATIENSGKPVIGLGDGGYDFFGLIGLSIGNPYGGHSSKNSIEVVDPNCSLFNTPYSIEIPQDRALQLYTETKSIGIYLWPTVPETVTVFGHEVNDVGYFPLVAEHNRYMLWGFTESPQKMTEIGKRLFINVVIRTANKAW